MKRLAPVLVLSLIAMSTMSLGAPAHAAAKAKKAAAAPVIVRAKPPAPARVLTVDGMNLPGQVTGTAVSMATTDGMKPRFWAGVNLGATLPGTWPGELAPTRKDYDRWLVQMAELGVPR